MKHLVGSAVDVTCTATCACTVNGTCSNAQLAYFSDGSCQGQATAIVVADGKCNATGGSGTVKAAKYTATAGATCTPSGSPAGTVALHDLATVCCRP